MLNSLIEIDTAKFSVDCRSAGILHHAFPASGCEETVDYAIDVWRMRAHVGTPHLSSHCIDSRSNSLFLGALNV